MASEEAQKMTERAVEWLENLEDATPQERAQFVAWLKESPRHVGEFLAVAAVCREFDGFDAQRKLDVQAMVAEVAPNVVELTSATPTAVPSFARRIKPLWAAAAAALIVVLPGAMFVHARYGSQTYTTATGEQRSIELADGSLIHVNAQSRLEVHFSGKERQIRLLAGEALFKVAQDSKRPFLVDLGNAMVEAVGTQFNIYRHPGITTLSVLEGKVRVGSELFAAGREADIARDGRVLQRAALNEVKVTAWRQRRLIFRSDRLADVAAEFNRYNRAPQIRVEGDVAQGRKLTGIFDADDPQSLVLFLAGSDLTVRTEGSAVVIRGR